MVAWSLAGAIALITNASLCGLTRVLLEKVQSRKIIFQVIAKECRKRRLIYLAS